MTVRRRRNTKNLYVVKSANQKLQQFEPKSQTETKSIYVLRTNEEIVNKYCSIIYNFVDTNGVFLLVTDDKLFYQSFKTAISYELGIELDFIRVTSDLDKAKHFIDFYKENGLKPLIFLEYSLRNQFTAPVLKYFKEHHPDVHVIVLCKNVPRKRLFQFHEEGADSYLAKPASANEIVKKIAFILRPHSEIEAMLDDGRACLRDNRFEEAAAIANEILHKRPGHPPGLVLLGDAFKGMAKRELALRAYTNAEKGAKMYLDPLKRLVAFHEEDSNRNEMLKYLKKLDHLSPHNCNRKIHIAEVHMGMGNAEAAEEYLDQALESAQKEAFSIVSEMALDIAEKAKNWSPDLAIKYYRKSLQYIKDSPGNTRMDIFNRLGIALRKEGMWTEAVEAYSEAEKLAPRDENIQYNKAVAYYEGGEHKQAYSNVQKALRLNPEFFVDKPDIGFQIGAICQELDKPKEALKFYKAVQAMNPTFRNVGMVIKKLERTAQNG
ncbi:tetratricopeptide repeat protein [Salidesulfovibrio onnuriiensis]|uniref:tetratricopeptide repeat protein n=1 Tax=Salidesulfovibrio onnuriiensis TaxID=2583823 RepID=UPI0011C99AAA|nr:tetratricopeptide repeat protein [Salidesulfovibrio onnuriiensis]